jgi:hypothetical protein
VSYSFVALRQAGFRPFLAGGVLAMMADNIEHVITYWVIFQHFKSPALGGFAVIAHWLPFLLFSVRSVPSPSAWIRGGSFRAAW